MWRERERERERERGKICGPTNFEFFFFSKMPLYSFLVKMKSAKMCTHFLY